MRLTDKQTVGRRTAFSYLIRAGKKKKVKKTAATYGLGARVLKDYN